MPTKKSKQEKLNELQKKIAVAEKRLENSTPQDIDKNLTTFIDLKKEYVETSSTF